MGADEVALAWRADQGWRPGHRYDVIPDTEATARSASYGGLRATSGHSGPCLRPDQAGPHGQLARTPNR